MPLIQLAGILIVVGVLLWLVNSFIPMQRSIKSILNGVVVIAVVLWLLNVFGFLAQSPISVSGDSGLGSSRRHPLAGRTVLTKGAGMQERAGKWVSGPQRG